MDEERPTISVAQMAKVHQRIYNQQMQDLLIYGTSAPFIYKKIPLWKRLQWRIEDFCGRVRDAWKVLTGKADIHE
jgi:hypothetical protein